MTDATINWISGPVLRARVSKPFRIYEAVLVGESKMLGEVIRLDNDEIVVQVYEDTTGLRPGDPLIGTDSELSVRLGPGLLGNIYDGLARSFSKSLTVRNNFFLNRYSISYSLIACALI